MNVQTKSINVQQETFTLTNQRALFWEEQKALILSDLHIGKTAHFRKNGIALANQIMKNDLERLSILIEYFKPEKFIVVGDLLHAGDNSDVDEFCEWRNQYSDLQFHLIEGNHDRISKKAGIKTMFKF
ncbi:metallophosphoesterase [Chryseobacterium sp. POE27]|uniref:metallophosphoesterase n=1 Tax=Chryseobacterium sp. POE27 TaxID=3138177 RepID=UPI00321A003D